MRELTGAYYVVGRNELSHTIGPDEPRFAFGLRECLLSGRLPRSQAEGLCDEFERDRGEKVYLTFHARLLCELPGPRPDDKKVRRMKRK